MSCILESKVKPLRIFLKYRDRRDKLNKMRDSPYFLNKKVDFPGECGHLRNDKPLLVE